MRAALLLLLAALAGAACAGGGDQCCSRPTRAGQGVRYVATIPSPDGGVPTEVEFVLDPAPTGVAGKATTTFRRGTQEVVETWSAKQRL